MTERGRTPPDAEVVERMERELPAQSTEEEEVRAAYQRLIGRIGDLEVVEPAPGWEDRAVERWRRTAKPRATSKPPRRVPWRPIAAAAMVTAAALGLLILRCGGREPPVLVVAVARTGPAHRQAGPAIGDTLHAHVQMDEPQVELRIYRDRVLVARCPGDARCARDGARQSIELVMDRPGRYEVIRLASRAPLPPPQATGLEVDVLEAQERGAQVTSEPPITVR